MIDYVFDVVCIDYLAPDACIGDEDVKTRLKLPYSRAAHLHPWSVDELS